MPAEQLLLAFGGRGEYAEGRRSPPCPSAAAASAYFAWIIHGRRICSLCHRETVTTPLVKMPGSRIGQGVAVGMDDEKSKDECTCACTLSSFVPSAGALAR
jgi:hypothetical protein